MASGDEVRATKTIEDGGQRRTIEVSSPRADYVIKVLHEMNAPPDRKPKEDEKIRILFLASEPSDEARLRLGEEIREIHEKLQLAKFRDRFVLEQRHAVRPVDITQALLDTNPHIVHFSGHGNSEGALCFENAAGESQAIPSEALAMLFEQFTESVRCVVLNACFSKVQAEAIFRHVKCVVGMDNAISDRAAVAFSSGFYQALGANRSIQEAYKLGCVQIGLQGIPEIHIPVLLSLHH